MKMSSPRSRIGSDAELPCVGAQGQWPRPESSAGRGERSASEMPHEGGEGEGEGEQGGEGGGEAIGSGRQGAQLHRQPLGLH